MKKGWFCRPYQLLGQCKVKNGESKDFLLILFQNTLV